MARNYRKAELCPPNRRFRAANSNNPRKVTGNAWINRGDKLRLAYRRQCQVSGGQFELL